MTVVVSLIVANFRAGTRVAHSAYYRWPATVGLKILGALIAEGPA
jgi:hypothetical protein